MNHNVVEFDHVSKRFSEKLALDEISFELPAGKVIGVVGTNGAGKTTLLKLIAGLLRPSEGNVLVKEKKVSRRISSEVAYLPEHGGYYPFYTVNETLEYYSTIYTDFDKNKSEEMLNFMELDRNQKVYSLSKGAKIRLKMVVALSRRAPIVLLDEPLAGLDPMIRESIIKGIVAFVDLSRQTVIMTTHEVSEIEPALDMVIAVKGGKIIKIDDVENIREDYGASLVEWMKKKMDADQHFY